MKLEAGRVAFVTGAARGIGLGTAKMLLARGVSVVGFDWNREALAEIAKDNAHFYGIYCDCSDWADVKRAFLEAIDYVGKVDVLVNNVGGFVESSFLKDSYEEGMAGFEYMMRICAGSTYAFTSLAAPRMAAEGEGVIINVLTNHMHRDLYRVSDSEHSYDAAKYAQMSLNMGMARELQPYGIRVNAVDPAATATDMLLQFLIRRDPLVTMQNVAERTPTSSLMMSEDVGLAICNLIEWEEPAPTGQNYLLRTRADCEAMAIPPQKGKALFVHTGTSEETV